jgi:hypothetical protein
VPSNVPGTDIPDGDATQNGENHDRDPMETETPTQVQDVQQQEDDAGAKSYLDEEELQRPTSAEPAAQNEVVPVDADMDEAKNDHDDEADHIVEGDEDDVIY